MAIQVYCHCGNPLFVPAELAGRKIKCNTCGQTLRVPQPESDAPDPEEAEKLQQSGRYEVVGGVPASARTKLEAAGKDAGGGGSVQLSCPACGGKVEIEDAACLSCGAELGGGARPGQGSGLLGSVPRPVLFAVVIVVGFGGLGLLVWRLWLGSRPSSYTAEGVAAMSDRDWARAREAFEQALEYDPNYTEAILNMGIVAAETHNAALINKWVPRALDQCKDKRTRAKLRLAYAEDLLAREKFRDAYNAANDASHEDDSLAGVAAIKGLAALQIYEGAKADEEAYAFLKQAVGEGEQHDWHTYYHLARIQTAKGEREDALVNAQKALELEEGSPELWWLLAGLREEAGQSGPARTALRKVVELQPENAAAYTRLSRLYLQAGDADEARRAAQKAKELAPDAVDAALALGRACVALEQWPPAKEELERAVKGNAGWEAEYLLGETLYRGFKDQKNGSQMLVRALEKRREDGAIHVRAGRVALEGGDAATAVQILQRGIKIDGRDYEMRLLLARALSTPDDQRRRNDRQIVESLELAREIAANRPQAWQELAAQHLALGRTKEALETIDAGLAACPGNVELLYEKGRICVAAGDKWNEAIQALEELQKVKGTFQDSERLLREAYEQKLYGEKG